MNKFDEQYYKTNNYANYLSKKERYLRTAEEIYQTFNKFSMLDTESTILDYGCGVGFLIAGFEKIGFNNVYGYDISEWASAKALEFGHKLISKPEGFYDLGIFLDVLEHMTDEQIDTTFLKLEFNKVLVRIPCSVPTDPKQFFLDVSRQDDTHINCKTPSDWIECFRKMGYKVHMELNMATIYNSDGCFCSLFIK
jgi:SAM-dependent methyltransferase